MIFHPPLDTTITNKTFIGNEAIIAINSITAGPAVNIESSTNVTFWAGNFIKLELGFWAKVGSSFHVERENEGLKNGLTEGK